MDGYTGPTLVGIQTTDEIRSDGKTEKDDGISWTFGVFGVDGSS